MKGRFTHGQVPWNKGTRGVMPKPTNGYTPGHMPATWRPIGSERRDKDGHLVRKVSDTRITHVDWQRVKDIVWCKHFGAIPPGKFVICKDRDPDNLATENLALVSRAENMQRNSFRTRYPELAKLYQLKGAINRQVNRINKNE